MEVSRALPVGVPELLLPGLVHLDRAGRNGHIARQAPINPREVERSIRG